MKAFDLLASSLGIRDEKPNKELAFKIIAENNATWVKELIGYLNHPDKNIQSDAIKTLYEIGENGASELLAPYAIEFGKLLQSKNNRLIWGAMTALDTIASVNKKDVFALLNLIVPAIDKGSVITIDHGVGVLAKLSTVTTYAETCLPLLFEQLRTCPAKQLPQYAEKSIIAINKFNEPEFSQIVKSRYNEMVRDTQRKRLDKVLRIASK